MLDTLANVKSRLGITGSTYDTFLTQEITLVSQAIEGYCRRSFTEKDYEQTFYGEDHEENTKIELFHYPITEVTSIEADGDTVDPTSYRIHKDSGLVIMKKDMGYFFGADETVVTYTAGYATVPAIVMGVLDSIVQERYNKKVAGVNLNFGSDVQRVSIPGAISIDFDYSLQNNDRKNSFGSILGNNMNLLDPYRSERSVLGDGKLRYVTEVVAP